MEIAAGFLTLALFVLLPAMVADIDRRLPPESKMYYRCMQNAYPLAAWRIVRIHRRLRPNMRYAQVFERCLALFLIFWMFGMVAYFAFRP